MYKSKKKERIYTTRKLKRAEVGRQDWNAQEAL